MEIGDKVKIIRYGHKMWFPKSQPRGIFLYEEQEVVYCDVLPELIGKTGKITAKKINGETKYMVRGVGSKSGWFLEEQLEEVF